MAREKRVARLDIVPLTAADAQRFTEAWERLQRRFVDNPKGAVTEADGLPHAALAKRRAKTQASAHQQIRELLTDVDALVARLKDVASIELTVFRARWRKLWRGLSARRAWANRAEQAFEETDRYVRSRPRQVAAAAAAGGLLIAVRSSHQQRRLVELSARVVRTEWPWMT